MDSSPRRSKSPKRQRGRPKKIKTTPDSPKIPKKRGPHGPHGPHKIKPYESPKSPKARGRPVLHDPLSKVAQKRGQHKNIFNSPEETEKRRPGRPNNNEYVPVLPKPAPFLKAIDPYENYPTQQEIISNFQARFDSKTSNQRIGGISEAQPGTYQAIPATPRNQDKFVSRIQNMLSPSELDDSKYSMEGVIIPPKQQKYDTPANHNARLVLMTPLDSTQSTFALQEIVNVFINKMLYKDMIDFSWLIIPMSQMPYNLRNPYFPSFNGFILVEELLTSIEQLGFTEFPKGDMDMTSGDPINNIMADAGENIDDIQHIINNAVKDSILRNSVQPLAFDDDDFNEIFA